MYTAARSGSCFAGSRAFICTVIMRTDVTINVCQFDTATRSAPANKRASNLQQVAFYDSRIWVEAHARAARNHTRARASCARTICGMAFFSLLLKMLYATIIRTRRRERLQPAHTVWVYHNPV